MWNRMRVWHRTFGAHLMLLQPMGSVLTICDSMMPMPANFLDDDVEPSFVPHPGVDDDIVQCLLVRFLAVDAIAGNEVNLNGQQT